MARGSLLLCVVGLFLVSHGAQFFSKDALTLNKDVLATNVSQEPTGDYTEQEAEERDDMLDAADSGSEVDVNAAVGASNTDEKNTGAEYPTEETAVPETTTATSTEITTHTEMTGNVVDIDELPSSSPPVKEEAVKTIDADDISEMSMLDACAACTGDGCPGHSCYTAKSEVLEGLESRPRFSWNCWNSSNPEFDREDVPPVGFTRCSAVHQGSLAKKQQSVKGEGSALLRASPQHHRVSLGHQLAALYSVMDRNKDGQVTFGEVMNTMYMERVEDFRKAHPQVVQMLVDWFQKATPEQRTHGVSLPQILKLVGGFLHTKLGDGEKEAQLVETAQQVEIAVGNFVTHGAACRACLSLDRCGSLGRCVAGPANTNPSFNWACGRLVGFRYTSCEGSSSALKQRKKGDDDHGYGDTTDNEPVTNDPDADETQAGGGQQVDGVSSQSRGGDGGAGDGGGLLL